MPTATLLDGTEVYYAVHRDGPLKVLLVHGAGGSHLAWPSALRRLPGATTYALDLPGHGRSSPPGRERIEEYVSDLLGFMDAVGIERGVVVGHSMGGAIAQMVGLTAPERVEGLVLVGTGARLRVAPAILEGIQTGFEATVRLISEWAWGPDADPALVELGRRLMEEAGPEVLLGDFLACDRFDVRERVGEIAAPVLILTGSEDRMTPLRFGEWLADRLPRGTFRRIEGAGHMVMLERPQEVQGAVLAFLADLRPERTG